MMCPSCNKFASLEMGDVEVDSLDVEHTAPPKGETAHSFVVTGMVRIVRTAACCGDEMKEANFDLEVEVDVEADQLPAGIDLEKVEVEEGATDTIEEGGSRYTKSFYGAQVNGTIVLGTGDVTHTLDWEWSDKVAASSMDELV